MRPSFRLNAQQVRNAAEIPSNQAMWMFSSILPRKYARIVVKQWAWIVCHWRQTECKQRICAVQQNTHTPNKIRVKMNNKHAESEQTHAAPAREKKTGVPMKRIRAYACAESIEMQCKLYAESRNLCWTALFNNHLKQRSRSSGERHRMKTSFKANRCHCGWKHSIVMRTSFRMTPFFA